MADPSCGSINALDVWTEEDLIYYQSKVSSGIESLIGRPDDNMLRALKENPKGNKRKINKAQKLFDMHTAIYNYLEKHLNELGDSQFYRAEVVDNVIAMLDSSLKKQFTFGVGDLGNFTDVLTVLGIKNHLMRTVRWKKPLKSINWWQKMTYEPLNLVISHDKLGWVHKVVRKVTGISDIIQTRAYGFTKRLTDVQEKLGNMLHEFKNTPNSIMFGGLDGFFMKKKVSYDEFDGNDEIKILKFKENKRIATVVKVDDSGEVIGKEVDIFTDDIAGMDSETIFESSQRAAITFIKGLMDGRIRNVTLKTRMDGHRIGGKGKATSDENKVNKILREMKELKEKSLKDGTVAVPHQRVHNRTDPKSGSVFSYIMIKQGEGNMVNNGKETYNAYIIQITDANGDRHFTWNYQAQNQLKDNGIFAQLGKELFKEGFYEAQEHRVYNREKVVARGKKGVPITAPGTTYRTYQGFQRLTHQPSSIVMNKNLANQSSVWNTVGQIRNVHKDYFDYIDRHSKKLHNDLNESLTQWEKYIRKQMMDEDGKVDEDRIAEMRKEILSPGGVEANIQIDDKTGEVILGMDYLKKVSINYDPVMFQRGEFEDALDAYINELEMKVSDVKSQRHLVSGDEKAALDAWVEEKEVELEGAKQAREDLAGQNLTGMESTDTIKTITNPSHLQRRTSFLNHMRRRTDASTLTEYIDNTTRSLYHNEVKIDMIKALINTPNIGLNEYLVNQVKIAFGEPDYKAEIMGVEMGNERIANVLNQASRLFKFGRKGKWTSADVQFYSIFNNAIWAAHLLGSWASINNNWQRLNPIVDFGFKKFVQVYKYSKSQIWLDRVERSGVTLLINAFNDMLVGSKSRESTLKDYAPLKTAEALLILKMPLKQFQDTGNKIIDAVIRHSAGLDQSDWKRLRQLRGDYWQLLHSDKEQANIVQARFKRLRKDISLKELRKGVGWKLGWIRPKSAEGFLTFSGTEKAMRTEAAILGMLMADELQLLKPLNETDIESRFDTSEARSMARTVVYNTMFGMSQQFLPGMFGGGGKSFMQFKSYPYFQYWHDAKIIQNWRDSAEGRNYLSKGINNGSRLVGSVFKGMTGRGQRKKPFLEQDIHNQRLLRVIMYRLGASTFGLLTNFTPPALDIFRATKSIVTRNQFAMSYIRGGENPVVGLLLRLFILGALHGTGDEEDRVMRDLYRFFLPPFLTVFIEMIASITGD